MCLKHGVQVFISTYATNDNVQNGGLNAIIQLARYWGVAGVRVLLPVPAGKWLKQDDVGLNRDALRALLEMQDPCFVFVEGICSAGFECNAFLKRIVYVSPYGDVQPCNFVPIVFGNVCQNSLGDIWEKMERSSLYSVADGSECLMQNKQFRDKFIEK